MNDDVLDNDNKFYWTFTTGYVLCYSLYIHYFFDSLHLEISTTITSDLQRTSWKGGDWTELPIFMLLGSGRARIVSQSFIDSESNLSEVSENAEFSQCIQW